MNYKKENKVQVLLDDDTFVKLNKLIGAEALENGTRIPSLSAWCRQLITDTINFEFNKKKIENFSMKRDIKKLNNK